MIRFFLIFFLFSLIPLSFTSAFATVDDLNSDKSVYFNGDTMLISGSVSSELDNPSVNVMVFAPFHSTIVTIAIPVPTANANGDFSASIHVGDGTWITYGTYFVQATSEGSTKEISIEYQDSSPTESPPETPEPTLETPEPTSETPEPTPELIPESTFTTLKLTIPNFPSLDKSPQYYIDRYNSEPSYKSWFDSQFPFNSIDDVVGYKITHIGGFPSFDKSPQYYIDRYNSEPSYKSWFDSQFPDVSIYNILGYEDPVSVPDWIRNNAEWWATGEIPDSTFISGIEFLLENNIIMISSMPSSETMSEDEIPDWIRNNAHWWSQDLISEDEFVNSLKFLIQEGIIIIN